MQNCTMVFLFFIFLLFYPLFPSIPTVTLMRSDQLRGIEFSGFSQNQIVEAELLGIDCRIG